ncbi:hypothetical protein ACFV1B_00440 [Streptomyces sp. NPDC059637]|uniref:hypothetical protein n=1 Tax=Streptomyces sp. NPDC059637 TaxID=3347752 RepID=UPI00368C3ECE
MATDNTLLDRKIVKRSPVRSGMQQFLLDSPVSFLCVRCEQTKKSRRVTVRGGHSTDLLCNGCYGWLQANGDDTPAAPPIPPTPPAPAAAEARGLPAAVPNADVPVRIETEGEEWGLPRNVTETGLSVDWHFTVRSEHLAERSCPVPSEMVRRLPGAAPPVTVVFFTGLRNLDTTEGTKAQPEIKGTSGRLSGVEWPACTVPGVRVKARWDMREKVRLSFERLKEPLMLGGTLIRHVYDPKVFTRDIGALDPRNSHTEMIVLLTLRELGLLDERGHAVLPKEALIRNTLRRSGPDKPSRKALETAVAKLLSRGELTRRMGSVNRAGYLRYPALPGGQPVEILVYAPAPRLATKAEIKADDARLGHAVNAHSVAGHLMRIGHLGKEASPAAKDAYRQDHIRAGLIGSHELPRGYTYVRPHDRGL